MLRRVTLVRTDISEERIACIIRVTKICELETTLAFTSNRSTRATRPNIPEDAILRSRRRDNLKSYTLLDVDWHSSIVIVIGYWFTCKINDPL
jgi:hypothetical protein